LNQQIINLFEIIFDIAYLTAIWSIIYLMTRSLSTVAVKDRPSAELIRLAFMLLAAGDTGHVGFQVIANLTGTLNAQIPVFGASMSLVGLGMLTTAYTVTFFYMVFVYLWKERFHQPDNWFTALLLATGLVRLIFMALPGNEWGRLIPPQPMSLYRNLPLILQGVGILALFLISAYKANDGLFKWVGWLIAASFAFYLPVILFAQRFPMIGMLMIPKTCAYLAIAWIAYRRMWNHLPANGKEIHPQAPDQIEAVMEKS
jgi:hypothetical protein